MQLSVIHGHLRQRYLLIVSSLRKSSRHSSMVGMSACCREVLGSNPGKRESIFRWIWISFIIFNVDKWYHGYPHGHQQWCWRTAHTHSRRAISVCTKMIEIQTIEGGLKRSHLTRGDHIKNKINSLRNLKTFFNCTKLRKKWQIKQLLRGHFQLLTLL